MFRLTREGLFAFSIACGALLAAAPAPAGSQDALPNTVTASGGGTVSQGNLKLHWTVGEAAAGTTSAGDTTLTAGFQATFLGNVQGGPAGNCSIFCNGFEN